MLRKLSVLALFLPGVALAGSLEHLGTPVFEQPVVGPYSVDLPAKRGLRAILPSDWRLYVQESAPLPPAISWDHTDTWVTVLQKMADTSDLAITVDWTRPAVFVAPHPTTITRRWDAAANASLRVTLNDWTVKSGWQLQWDLPSDLQLLTKFEYTGNLEGAVEALLAAVKSSAGPNIKAGLYNGNKTLRVHAPAP